MSRPILLYMTPPGLLAGCAPDEAVSVNCQEEVSMDLAAAPTTVKTLTASLGEDDHQIVEWSRTLNGPSSEIQVEMLVDEESAVVVTRTQLGGTCRPGPDLRVDVTARVGLDDATPVEIEGVIEASGSAESQIFLNLITGEVSLPTEWNQLASAQMEKEAGAGGTPTWWLTLSGTWSTLQVDIDGRQEDETADAVSNLWRGISQVE